MTEEQQLALALQMSMAGADDMEEEVEEETRMETTTDPQVRLVNTLVM